MMGMVMKMRLFYRGEDMAAHTRSHANSKLLGRDEIAELKLDAMSLSLNENTYAIPCPKCGEKSSFSVTREYHGLLYNCFRASCGIKGFISTSGKQPAHIHQSTTTSLVAVVNGKTTTHPSRRKAGTNPYGGFLEEVPTDIRRFLYEKYGLLREEIVKAGWKYEKLHHRLAMPMYSYMGYRFGWTLKRLPTSTHSVKAMKYLDRADGTNLAFANTSDNEILTGTTVCVVEDIISATKCGRLLPSVALLGTSMNDTQAGLLATHFDKMIIMLDPDANQKALEIGQKYRGLFKVCRVMAMEQDPKDTDQEILDTIALET